MGKGAGHTEGVGAVAFSKKTSEFCVSGGQDRTIKLWDTTAVTDEGAYTTLCIERIPFGLSVFDLPHIVFGRFSPKIEAVFRFASKPPDFECTGSCSSVDLAARFSIFTTGLLRPNPNSHSKRNLLDPQFLQF